MPNVTKWATYVIIINSKGVLSMRICELTIQAFTEFVKNSPLKSYMQSEEYARFMGEEKYNYDYIGLVDEDGVIRAASLILWRKIGLNMRYGYAPKGFLINYYDDSLVKMFTEELKKYYAKKNMAFIKINPEIVVAEIDNRTFQIKDNPNMKLKQNIQRFGFIKLKDNLYFESLNPRFNAYIDLKNSKIENYSKPNRNKVRNATRKGLFIEKGTEKDLEAYYKLKPHKRPFSYYRNMVQAFKDKMDIILVRVNYENFIKNSQSLYETELDNNNLYNEILHRSQKEADLHRKMASDAKLCVIKNEIINATEGLRDEDNCIVAGALVIKEGNRVHVVDSAFDKNHPLLNANYYLYDSLIRNYKDEYDYLDIGGISGDFKKSNPYKGLNNFKLGFDAKIYEYIGEFDFIIDRTGYDNLLSTGRLANEFNK